MSLLLRIIAMFGEGKNQSIKIPHDLAYKRMLYQKIYRAIRYGLNF